MNTQSGSGSSTPGVAGDITSQSDERGPKTSTGGRAATIIFGAVIILLLAGSVVWLTYTAKRSSERTAAEAYTLVPEKVSQSAAIALALPEELPVAGFDPVAAVRFAPAIEGTWESAPDDAGHYLFRPKEKLPVGTYYLATLETPEMRLEKMFSVDKDPTVLAVFPRPETDANEFSNITIMFSRPMVALSTLSENADVTPPVEITPETRGRFKWITTRTLQFIPETRLVRSAQYRVTVRDGLTSLDGVSVPPFEHVFTTRKLEYHVTQGERTALRHAEPLRIYFNQPIDLEKTRPQITLTNTLGAQVPFTLSYGTREVAKAGSERTEMLEDRSVLEIYAVTDEHGRQYLWDLGKTYSYKLSGAHPLEGTIALATPRSGSFSVEEIVTGVSATSPRSGDVTPEIFDPSGTLVFRMSEPIDLDRSRVSGKGISKIAYGEKCFEEEGFEFFYNSANCRKVPDEQSIVVSFDPAAFGLGETSSVLFEKLVNIDGVTLNNGAIAKSFTTYKAFNILRTTPADGAGDASLKELVLCSTNPIATPADDEFYEKIRANMMIGKWNWGRSYLVTSDNQHALNYCAPGTFLTTIHYGLVPKYAYELTLELTDHFGQTLTRVLKFTTRDADPLAKGFVHMQPEVVMTAPDRTTLTYGLDFMDEIDMTICKVSPEAILRYRVDPPKITDGVGALSCLEQKAKHLALPPSPATRKYVQVDLASEFPDPIGHYVLVFSNPDYRRVTRNWDKGDGSYTLGEQLFEKTFLTVTRLSVASKHVERVDNARYWRASGEREVPDSFMEGRWPKNLYWVTDYRTLLPAQGAVVTPYFTSDKTLVKRPAQVADADGIALAPSENNVAGAVVTRGKDSAIVTPRTDAFSYAQPAFPSRREYIYTDRPIYRPGDTVHVKGISRVGYDAKYEADAGKERVEIRDARYEKARTEEVVFGKNGTYEMSFTLDQNAPLGYYQITTTGGGYGSFEVEEYVAPQFRVDVSADKEEYVSGDRATFTLGAAYYFGVPVDGGEAEYRIVAQDYYFDRYRDGYFNFGGGWYEYGGWYGDTFVTSGRIALDASGKGSFSEELAIDKLFAEDYRSRSKLITVHATVKNSSGQSVSSQKSFVLHRGDFYAGLAMDDYFYATGANGAVRVKTVDVKGAPVRRTDLSLTLARVEWKSYKRQEVDGNFYYRTERVKVPVSETSINTDRDGNALHEFTAGEAGEYEFTITGKDAKGNTVSASYMFYVSGRGAVAIRPTNNETLELVSEATDLSVGATGKFVIKSPFPRAKALVTIASGDIYERKIIDVTSQLTEYEFRVNESHIPGVTAEVLLISPDPEVKYGALHFRIDAKEKKLNIGISPNKKTYLPGEEVTLDLEVTDSAGKPIKTELSLSVVDMSVLALLGNPKKDPVSFFYDGRPLSIRTSSNIKNILHIAEIPTGTKGGSGGGGDDLEKKKRGVFRDTAYWEGTIVTDANGRAQVRFTLPDNLTEWQAESIGVTTDTKVGAGYGTFTTRKTIMALPLKPRFILPGDTFAVGGTIFNESDESQRLAVTISSPSLEFTGEREVRISVDPHSSVSISFPAKAPEGVTEGTHAFTLSAKNDAYEDTVESTFPVERNNTYEFTATAGRVSELNLTESLYLPKDIVPNRGSLEISVAATMASVAEGALGSILIYPYECSEQTASKLKAIAIVKRNADLFGKASEVFPEEITIRGERFTVDEVVERGLAKLYQLQYSDGGVPFYKNMPADYSATLLVLQTYLELKQAGYAVDESKIAGAAQYIANSINYPKQPFASDPHQLSDAMIIEGIYTLGRVDKTKFVNAAMRQKMTAYAGDAELVRRRLSSPSLAYLTIFASEQNFSSVALNRLFAEFENRSHIDARGTTVLGNADQPRGYFENSTSNTALALKAFSEAKRESPLLEGFIRAIRSGRSKDGGWSSTYNSALVIDAVTQYLVWKDEANARFTLSVALDDKEVLSAAYDKANVLETRTITVPISSIETGKGHRVTFTKKNEGIGENAYYYDMLLRYFLPTDAIASRDEGFSIERAFYRKDDIESKTPVYDAVQGEVLRARVIIRTPTARTHVTIEDFIPAGMEIVNQRFATEDQTLGGNENGGFGRKGYGLGKAERSPLTRFAAAIFNAGANAGPKRDLDGTLPDETYANRGDAQRMLYPSAIENHDDRIFAYVYRLEPGEYVYEYFVRALIPGAYQHLPAVVSELYTPENFGRTAGSIFTVNKK